MLQVRPYTGFVLTIAITISALWLNRTDRSVVLRVFSIGAVFGCVALACLFLYNHIYTGRWLVSPYAMAAGIDTPPELSLDPAKIWRGLQQYAPQTAEETLAGSFPFVYLLAGYALVREKNRRKEVWILASIYLALVIAYLAHPDGSGVFFGERFHFEGFFVVLLLAARGWQLLLDHWRFPRWAAVWTMLLFAAMQILQLAATVRTVADRVEPYRKVREAVMASGVTGLVLLHDSPGFVAKHFNLNEADWRHAPRIYLIDAEPDRRDEWACRYGVSNWTVITYGAKEDSASVLPGTPNCTNLHDDRTP
jgi:heme/copper-type cytochrome/quinol oxidase subunit 4